MNISKLSSVSRIRNILSNRYANSAVVKKVSNDSEIELLAKEPLEISKTRSGISVISAENYGPIALLSILIKAGSRFESGTNLGAAHALRTCANLSSTKSTAFAITRNIEQEGGKLWVTATRENILYTVQCMRDNIDPCFRFLSEIACHQAFKPWEIEDVVPRMKIDLAVYQKHPEAMLMEALHKAAFRGGLSNSLYSSDFMIGKHDSQMLQDYVGNHFTASRTSIVGINIDERSLETDIDEYLGDMKIGGAEITGESKFGGGEVRIEADTQYTQAAIVAEGASLSNTKEKLSLDVLQCLLGFEPIVKHSSGCNTKLGAAAAKATSNKFSVSCLNLNYTDTGMFGVHIAGHPNDMKQLVKSIVIQMREETKNLSEEEINNAKNALKTRIYMNHEGMVNQSEEIASQVAASGQFITPAELEKSIDSLSVADISAVAAKVMKTKPAMAAVGPLHSTPYLDELI